jgi:O-antigen ligase
MAPWGPILRYFGWLLFLVGYSSSILRGEQKKQLIFERKHIIILTLFLAWGGINSFLGCSSLYLFGKGFSIPLEFVFGIWASSKVLIEVKNRDIWKKVIVGSVLTATIWTMSEIIFQGSLDGPFSNINTLGLYSCIITPLVFSIALSCRNDRLFSIFSWFSFAGGVFMLILSFSTSAWLSGSIALLIVLFCGIKHISRGAWLRLMAGGLVVLSLFVVVISAGGSGNLERSWNREIRQIFSLSSKGSIEDFTNHRSVIWQGTWKMIKMKPVTGWGWHMLRHRYKEFNPDLVKKIGIPLEAHNMYLEILFNGGFPSFFLLFWIWLSSMKGLWRYRTKDPFALGMFATLAGLLVFSMAGNVFASRDIACIVWAIIGFGLIVPRLDFEPV